MKIIGVYIKEFYQTWESAMPFESCCRVAAYAVQMYMVEMGGRV